MRKPEARPYERTHKIPQPGLNVNELAMCRAFAATPHSVEVADEPEKPAGQHSPVAKFLRKRGFIVEEFHVDTVGGDRRVRVWARWPHGLH